MATLSNTEILQDTLEAFKVQFPMLVGPNGFGTDFSNARAKKDDQIIAHIRTLPSVQSYDGTNGYKANGAEASSLLTDVPVTLNQHKHVPVKVDHLDQLASRKNLYEGAVADMAYVLGKSVVDYACGLMLATNFSYSLQYSIAATSKDVLDASTKQLNANGAARGRFGIVNGDFFNALEQDSRIASRDYSGQMRGGEEYGHLQNVSGFKNVWEYPGLSANGENLSAFFGAPNAIAIASRLPADPMDIAKAAGIPVAARFDTVTDPQSGLSLLGIQWVDNGTFDIWLTVALLYGASAGKQTGAANAITDKAGVRIVTQ